jgi:hypothetical protein
MRIYPEVPSRRANAVVRDALVVALLILFAWIGVAVHDAVDRLAVLGHGVAVAGTSVENGFDSAGDAVDNVPLVGGPLGGALRGAGEGTGGNVADLGRAGEDAVHRLALILGLVIFGVPAAVLLLAWLPNRIRAARELTEAERVLRPDSTPERRRLLAMRAAFSLPYGQLLAYTRDPLGDLAAERYDALVAAALEDAGLRAPATS